MKKYISFLYCCSTFDEIENLDELKKRLSIFDKNSELQR